MATYQLSKSNGAPPVLFRVNIEGRRNVLGCRGKLLATVADNRDLPFKPD
jgi:hypothetical protein